MIPWGHIKLLIDKCHDNLEKFNFYIDKVIENNWSRAVLLNFLGTDLYERQGKAITNFKYTLPKETGDLAQEITKDPYNFDFIAICQGYNEKELKNALMDNVQNFLNGTWNRICICRKRISVTGWKHRIICGYVVL